MHAAAVLALIVGCRARHVDDPRDNAIGSNTTGILCRPDAPAPCVEWVVVEFAATSGHPCDSEPAADERCLSAVFDIYALEVDGEGDPVGPGGCSLRFRWDGGIASASVLVPNGASSSSEMRVALDDDQYVVRLRGEFGIVDFEGCVNTAARAMATKDHVDEVVLSLDVEPEDEQLIENPVLSGDEFGVPAGSDVAYWVYPGDLEIVADDVRLRIPLRAIWWPPGGPRHLHERDDDALKWYLITTWLTFEVPHR